MSAGYVGAPDAAGEFIRRDVHLGPGVGGLWSRAAPDAALTRVAASPATR